MINEYNIIKSINKLIKDNVSEVINLEVLSLGTKLNKAYFNKKVTSYPFLFSYINGNNEDIAGVNPKYNQLNDILTETEYSINIIMMFDKNKDAYLLPDTIKEMLRKVVDGKNIQIPIYDFEDSLEPQIGYVNIKDRIYISPYSFSAEFIGLNFAKYTKEMVFGVSIFKEY